MQLKPQFGELTQAFRKKKKVNKPHICSLTCVEEHSDTESVKPQFQSVIYFKDLFFLTLLLNVHNHYNSGKVPQQISGIWK